MLVLTMKRNGRCVLTKTDPSGDKEVIEFKILQTGRHAISVGIMARQEWRITREEAKTAPAAQTASAAPDRARFARGALTSRIPAARSPAPQPPADGNHDS